MPLRVSKQKKQRPNFFGMVFELLRFTSNALASLNYQRLNLLYKIHLLLRKPHDILYSKNGKYKTYSDLPVSRNVHKATVLAFFVSFTFFSLMQYILPNIFNFSNPNVAMAGANSVTWSTTGDFNNNDITGRGATSVTNIDTLGNQAKLNSQIDYFSEVSKIASSSGAAHNLAIKNDGTVWAWGNNSYGQLGNNTTNSSNVPVQVKDSSGTGYLADITQIAVSNYFSLALKSDGTVWSWGGNSGGYLGDNTTTQRLLPIQVKGPSGSGFLTGITAISAGYSHSLALKSDGTVWAWGGNGVGQLGDNSSSNRSTPVQVKDSSGTAFLTEISAVAAGDYHSLAIKNDGTVWSWGRNYEAQLGDSTTSQRSLPVQVKDTPGTGYLTGITAVSGGTNYSLALKNDGTVWAWGNNTYGGLGDNTTTQRSTPVQVKDTAGTGYLTGITSIAAANQFSLAIKNDGTGWGWGYNTYGQLGDGSYNQKKTPVQIKDESGVANFSGMTVISGGNQHSVAVKNDGTAWGWGVNTSGQLGNGAGNQVLTPGKVVKSSKTLGFSGITSISSSAEGTYSLALKNDGTVWAWGSNYYGQAGNNYTSYSVSNPIAVKDSSGNDLLSGIIAVSAGRGHAMALKNDGTVWAWGDNSAGQIGDNTNTIRKLPVQVKGTGGSGFLTGVTAISAGAGNSYAVKNDGTVWGWGSGTYGAVGDNTVTQRSTPSQVRDAAGTGYLTGITAVASGGYYYALALKNDGTVWGWGYNPYGQLGDNTTTQRSLPVQVKDTAGTGYLTGVVSIKVGDSHTIAVKNDGTVWAWGSNANGQLGDSTTTHRYTPIQVKDPAGADYLTGITSISAGAYHSLARKNDGTVWAWGSNSSGHLGDNTFTQRSLPIQVKDTAGTGYLTGINDISSGTYYSIALKEDGTVWAWGENNVCQLGDGSSANKKTPVNTVLLQLGVAYLTSGSITSLKLNTSSKASWSTISWNLAEALPVNTAIKFRTRSADTEAALSSATWSSYYTNSGSSINSSPGYWLEIELAMDSDGSGTPTLNDFSVSYDTLETPVNSNLTLKKTGDSSLSKPDGAVLSAGNPGGYTNESSVKVTATNLVCTDCGTSTNIRPEVEAKPLGTAFDGTGTFTANTGNNYALVTGLVDSTSYHLQVRAVDDQGRVSAWVSYGANPENEADFTVEQTAPTISTFTIGGSNVQGGFAKSTSVTLNLSASDTGSSALSKMRFSNDGATWSDWENYAETKNWTLASGDGQKTVYAQVKDNAGNISSQIVDSDFSGSTLSQTQKRGSSIQLQGQTTSQVSYSTDEMIGICHYGSDSWVQSYNYSTIQIGNPSQGDCDRRLFFKFNNNGGDSKVYLKLYVSDFYSRSYYDDILVSSIPDYGDAVDQADYNVSAYSSIPVVRLNPQSFPNPFVFDVTDLVKADKTASRNVSTFRLQGMTGSRASTVFYAYEGGASVRPTLEQIADSPYNHTGTITSRVLDSGSEGTKYDEILKSESVPSGGSISYQVRAGNSAIPDGSWTGWFDVTNSFPEAGQGMRFFQYQASFTAGTSDLTTPALNNILFTNLATKALVTLDTTPPNDVSNLKTYENLDKNHELTNGGWYPYNAPYFEWSANNDPDLVGYKYCFSTDSNCSPTTDLGNVTNYTVNPALNLNDIYYFKVVAYDGAGNNSTNPASFTYKFDNTVPGAVTGLTASNNDMTRIILTWNTPPAVGAPIDNYILERVRYNDYINNAWNLNSNWSTGLDYATFTLTNVGFTDDSANPAQGQTAIQTSVKYVYRIKVKDTSNSNYSEYQASPVYGLTRDGLAPTDPTNVIATACDGTAPNCSDVANRGFEAKIVWDPSNDVGTGMAKYNIYRASNAPDNPANFVKVGEVDFPGLVFFDNDTTDPGNLLNDYTTYYYRVTATDQSGNESPILPTFDPFLNSDSATTPDVTAPTVPADAASTPVGLDPSGTKQRISLTWTGSVDLKARSAGSGSGVKEYNVYRSQDQNGPYDKIGTTQDLSYNDDGLDEFTYYYYQVSAVDNASPVNESEKSSFVSSRTASNAVPTVPLNISVSSLKGDPANTEVGHKATVAFNGSYSKNCLNNIRCIVRYEVYRSTENYAVESDWLNPAKATKLKMTSTGTRTYNVTENGSDITPTRNDDDRDNVYTITDSGLNNSQTYYFKIRTIDNTPAVPDGGPFNSALSAVSVGTIGHGWDTTPDVTAPGLPQELKVKDIHDDGMNYKRNIITWARIATPTRNGTNDFYEYRVYRSNDGLAWSQICTNGLAATCSDDNPNPLRSRDSNLSYSENQEISMATNYYMDLIPISQSNQYYYYYVTAADDAGTHYKYSNGTVINAFSNESKPAIDSNGNKVSVSLNPAIAKPSINTISSGSFAGLKAAIGYIGVSSATITWATDQSADSIVEFKKKGTNDPYIGTINRAFVINHSVTIKPLEPNTEYDYRVISRNYLANDVIASGSDLPALKTSGFNITFGGATTTTSTSEVTWNTNLDASSAFVEYQLQRLPGDDPQGGTAGVEPNDLASSPRNHRVIVKGLRSNRTYTYKIKSISTDGYVAETEFLTFKTRNFDSDQFTIAPSSSNVAERNITSTSAQIVWQTSIPTTSWVDYATIPGIKNLNKDNVRSIGNNELVYQHVVLIEGLVPGTKYYYQVRGADANEQMYTSQESSFTAVLKPKISNFRIDEVKPYLIKVSWETNVDTETVVNFGKTTGYGEKRGKSEMTRAHALTLEGLEDNTEYHLQITAHDETGNEVVDEDKSIRTPLDTEGPKIENVKTDILPMGSSDTTASVVISWTTNKPATTMVEYDEGIISGNYTKSSIEDKSLNTSHTVIIKELKPASSYHYRIVSKDKRTNLGMSQDFTFVTPSQEKSILQLILKSLEETFAWTRNMNKFIGGVANRFRGR